MAVYQLNYRAVNPRTLTSRRSFISTSCQAVLTASQSALLGSNSMDRWDDWLPAAEVTCVSVSRHLVTSLVVNQLIITAQLLTYWLAVLLCVSLCGSTASTWHRTSSSRCWWCCRGNWWCLTRKVHWVNSYLWIQNNHRNCLEVTANGTTGLQRILSVVMWEAGQDKAGLLQLLMYINILLDTMLATNWYHQSLKKLPPNMADEEKIYF